MRNPLRLRHTEAARPPTPSVDMPNPDPEGSARSVPTSVDVPDHHIDSKTPTDRAAGSSEASASSSLYSSLEPRFPVWHRRFASSGRTRIELKERGAFHDADGNLLFAMRAKTVTMSGRIVIDDAEGRRVGHVRRRRRPASRATYYFGNPSREKVGTVRAKSAKTRSTECDAEIYLGDALVGETIGNWFKKSFYIYFGGLQVAEAYRRAGCVEGGFCVEIVTEGVDASFVIMVVLALGQMYDWADGCHGGVCSSVLSGKRGDLSNSTTTTSSAMSCGSSEDGSDSFPSHT